MVERKKMKKANRPTNASCCELGESVTKAQKHKVRSRLVATVGSLLVVARRDDAPRESMVVRDRGGRVALRFFAPGILGGGFAKVQRGGCGRFSQMDCDLMAGGRARLGAGAEKLAS